MREHGLVKNANNIWVAYSGQTGRPLGDVLLTSNGKFQAYVAHAFANDSREGCKPLGAPHATLKEAAEALWAFFR